jgi:hypothetical protein
LDSTAGNSDYILVEYKEKNSTVTNTYRCYLNGDRILVGYEFTVPEKGTYILGTAAGEAPVGNIIGGNQEDTSVNYPMEIVFCSADGTASPGSDGTAGSVYGSIDYVYDYNEVIINVQDYSSDLVIDKTNNNYYFNSHSITYTDNSATGFPDIGELKVYIRRSVVDGTRTITIYTDDADKALFLCKTMGVDTDIVTIVTDPPPTGSG